MKFTILRRQAQRKFLSPDFLLTQIEDELNCSVKTPKDSLRITLTVLKRSPHNLTMFKDFKMNRVWILGAILIFVSIVLRAFHMGQNYSGWDVLGIAEGIYKLKTMSLWEAVNQIFHQSRNYQYWCTTDSLILSLIPASFYLIFPWEYWAHAFTFFLSFFAFYLSIRTLRPNSTQLAVILFALASSSIFMTFSISYPYISALLPHAIAFSIVRSDRLRDRPRITFILGLILCELSFHLYEIGRLFFGLFLTHAVFDKEAKPKTRFAWGLVGTLMLGILIHHHLFRGQGHMVHQSFGTFGTLVGNIPNLLMMVFDYAFVRWEFDLPILIALGFVALFYSRPLDRKTLGFMLLGCWILIFSLAQSAEWEMRPRRFLLVQYYNFLLVASLVKNYKPSPKNRYSALFFIALFATIGTFWQIGHTISFSTMPISHTNRSMPYILSKADFFVRPNQVSWADEIVDRLSKNESLILIYNFYSFPENTTDPLGLLERIYLKIGHEQFQRHVLVPTDRTARYSHVPFVDKEHFIKEIERIKNSNKEFEIHIYKDTTDPNFNREREEFQKIISENLILDSCQPIDQNWDCMTAATSN
ncbi:MAG: hypothetical protein KDD25_00475 [Bdellovibrionales bacterium]|nr:hypothetical protein [Bdellovibrionales bacterium]